MDVQVLDGLVRVGTFIDDEPEAVGCEAFAARGQDIDLKIFSASETAASHAQLDNPTIGNEFIFDWIAERLGRKRATAKSRAAKSRAAMTPPRLSLVG